MSFRQSFRTLRRRRRITTRAFEAYGIPSSYITAIEKDGLLPGPEKLKVLTRVFVKVAEEQDAKNPLADARILRKEHDRTVFVRKLKIKPGIAELFVELKDIASTPDAKVDLPLRTAAGVLSKLGDDQRAVVAQGFDRVSKLPEEQRKELLAAIARTTEQFLRRAEQDPSDAHLGSAY